MAAVAELGSLDAMRYLILFLMLCLSARAAEKTDSINSLEGFSRLIRESYEKKDGAWMLKHSDTNGVPDEILAAQEQMFRAFWGIGGLEVTSVQTFRFDDYKPVAAPGEYQGRKLRFITKPTHWVVLKAQSPKLKDGKPNPVKTSVALEFPVIQQKGEWRIVGGTYAD